MRALYRGPTSIYQVLKVWASSIGPYPEGHILNTWYIRGGPRVMGLHRSPLYLPGYTLPSLPTEYRELLHAGHRGGTVVEASRPLLTLPTR